MPNPPTCRSAWPVSPTTSARFASSPNETSQTSSPGASSTRVATGPLTMPRTCWLETFGSSSADSADDQLGGQDVTLEEAPRSSNSGWVAGEPPAPFQVRSLIGHALD